MRPDSRVASGRASARLSALVLVLLLLSGLLAGCGDGGRNVTIRVIYAGSLIIPFPALQKAFEEGHPGVKIESEAHGSIQVLRQVSDIHQKADVLISADCNLIPLLLYNTAAPDTGTPYADWYVKFATNEMAIAFTEKSRYAAEVTSNNWNQVLARQGVRVGIADPRFDANGYRALMVLKLADAVYKKPTLFFDFFDGAFVTPITIAVEGSTSVIQVPEIVETRPDSRIVVRGYSVQLLPLLETGEIDYAVEYLSVIKQHQLKYVTLPPELNLGAEGQSDRYRQVSVRLDYQRFATVKPEFPGEPIGYGATIPTDAPNPKEAAEFIAFLAGPECRRILQSFDHPTLDPPESDHVDLPAAAIEGAVRRSSMTLLFSLAGALILLFVVLPLAATVVGAGPGAMLEALIQPDVLRSFGITFVSALIATSIAVLCGLPLAYLLARREFPGKGLVEGIIDIPIIVPHTAAGIALLMVFGRSGFVGRPLAALSLYFTDDIAGIVLAMLFVSLPLFVDSAREAIAAVDPRLEGVARTLGVSSWRAVGRVTLPLAWRGILAGGILMWARGISEFGAVVILAYNPKVISVLTYERFSGFGLAEALPVTALLVVVALLVLVVLRGVLARRRPGRGRRAR